MGFRPQSILLNKKLYLLNRSHWGSICTQLIEFSVEAFDNLMVVIKGSSSLIELQAIDSLHFIPSHGHVNSAVVNWNFHLDFGFFPYVFTLPTHFFTGSNSSISEVFSIKARYNCGWLRSFAFSIFHGERIFQNNS